MGKSLAGSLLEKIKEDDVPGLLQPGQGPGDAPNDKDAAPAQDQPADAAAGMPKLQEVMDMMDEPDKMAEALDMMGDKCEAYMDSGDQSTFTAADDAEKKGVMEARSKMREAAMKMRGMKKK